MGCERQQCWLPQAAAAAVLGSVQSTTQVHKMPATACARHDGSTCACSLVSCSECRRCSCRLGLCAVLQRVQAVAAAVRARSSCRLNLCAVRAPAGAGACCRSSGAWWCSTTLTAPTWPSPPSSSTRTWASPRTSTGWAAGSSSPRERVTVCVGVWRGHRDTWASPRTSTSWAAGSPSPRERVTVCVGVWRGHRDTWASPRTPTRRGSGPCRRAQA